MFTLKGQYLKGQYVEGVKTALTTCIRTSLPVHRQLISCLKISSCLLLETIRLFYIWYIWYMVVNCGRSFRSRCTLQPLNLAPLDSFPWTRSSRARLLLARQRQLRRCDLAALLLQSLNCLLLLVVDDALFLEVLDLRLALAWIQCTPNRRIPPSPHFPYCRT